MPHVTVGWEWSNFATRVRGVSFEAYAHWFAPSGRAPPLIGGLDLRRNVQKSTTSAHGSCGAERWPTVAAHRQTIARDQGRIGAHGGSRERAQMALNKHDIANHFASYRSAEAKMIIDCMDGVKQGRRRRKMTLDK